MQEEERYVSTLAFIIVLFRVQAALQHHLDTFIVSVAFLFRPRCVAGAVGDVVRVCRH